MEKVLIKDAHIVNEGTIVRGDVYIEHGIILEISQNLSVKGPDVHVLMLKEMNMSTQKMTAILWFLKKKR